MPMSILSMLIEALRLTCYSRDDLSTTNVIDHGVFLRHDDRLGAVGGRATDMSHGQGQQYHGHQTSSDQ